MGRSDQVRAAPPGSRGALARSTGARPSDNSCLPYKPLDLFPTPPAQQWTQSSHDLGASPRSSRSTPARQSLSTMAFDHSPGSSILFRLSAAAATSSSATTPRSPGRVVDPPSEVGNDSTSRSSTPSSLIGSLRATTLLDYGFMREFALMKRRPLRDRNLSRLSTQSVYNMRATQLALEQQARRALPFDHSVADTSKADGEARAAAPVVTPRKQILTTKLTDSSPPSQEASTTTSPFFPTLWTNGSPSQAPSQPVSSTGTATDSPAKLMYDSNDFKRSVPPAPGLQEATTSMPTPPQQQQQSTRPNRHRHHRTSSTDTSSSKVSAIVWQDLSEFDRRKCHSAAVITELHGHLTDQDLTKLGEKTGYNRTELFALWARFKALCSISKTPQGVDKDMFQRGIPQLELEDQLFIDRIFDNLDADGSGVLEWQEFIEALSVLEKGDVDARVALLFRVYDLSGDGTIRRGDIHRFFLASLLVEGTDQVVDVAKHFTDEIFLSVGRGDCDSIRTQDVVQYLRDHPANDIFALLGRTMVPNNRSIVDKVLPIADASNPAIASSPDAASSSGSN